MTDTESQLKSKRKEERVVIMIIGLGSYLLPYQKFIIGEQLQLATLGYSTRAHQQKKSGSIGVCPVKEQTTTPTMVIIASQTKKTFIMSLLFTLAALERKAVLSFQPTGRLARQGVSRSVGSSTSILYAKAKNIYADTIILPQTEFSQRANAIKREPELQEYWNSSNLYSKLSDAAAANGADRFVLHDGPPYANGDLHIGHALNKLLKDFINRHQIMKGKQCITFLVGIVMDFQLS
jgi:hypothetical protein